jgi:tRNA(adenine34) deaminase
MRRVMTQWHRQMIAGLSPSESRFLRQAVELALEAEQLGNLPIAAVIVLGDEIVASGANRSFSPSPHPGRHAEVLALAAIPDDLVARLPEMTCYCTLEPCLMCFGALVLHRMGRVVFGASDPRGGAVSLIDHLPPYVAAKARAMTWAGPVWPEVCDPLCQRALARYWTR